MTDPLINVFVNDIRVEVPAGGSVRTAVQMGAPDLESGLRDGSVYVTDGVGRPIDVDTPVMPGGILRVIRSARRDRDSESG